MNNFSHFDFYGLKLSSFEEDALDEYFKAVIKSRRKAVCFGYSLGTFPYFKKHPEIATYANTFNLMVCDGRGIYLLAKLMGYPVKSDLSIPNLSWKVLELANKEKYTVLITGSMPENNKRAVERARKLYPNANFVPGHDGGMFTPEDQKQLAEYVNRFSPDILFVGVTSPKKEAFVYHHRDNLNVSLIIPFGGAIDILSGKSKPIPKIIKKLLLGSLWRFIQEPRRLFRDSILYTLNVMFILMPSLISARLRRKKFSIPDFYKEHT